MRVRCTSIVDKDVSPSCIAAMNWLGGLLEPALSNKSFGDSIDQFMVIAIGIDTDPVEEEKIVQSSTGCIRYKDPFSGQQVRLLSIGLPVGYQRIKAFDQKNLRHFIVESLLDKLNTVSLRVPTGFDYGNFVDHVRNALEQTT